MLRLLITVSLVVGRYTAYFDLDHVLDRNVKLVL
jgi:hypothetical protein